MTNVFIVYPGHISKQHGISEGQGEGERLDAGGYQHNLNPSTKAETG